MKTVVCLIALILCSCASSPKTTATSTAMAKPVKGFKWTPNPANQQITEYRVYKQVGNSGTLVATVTTPQYTPTQTGRYYVTAVNVRAESPPSKTIKL